MPVESDAPGNTGRPSKGDLITMNAQIRFAPACLILAGILAFGSSVASAAGPLFGPTSIERTSGPPDAYSDSFTSVMAGTFILWVENGDDGGHRVTGASVSVNGTALLSP